MTRSRTATVESGVGVACNERRTHARSNLIATAVVWTDSGGPMHYLVENLSIGGALLAGGPLLAIGERIRLTLQVERRTIGPVSAETVRRGDPAGMISAVAFRGLGVGEEDAIQQALLDELEAEARVGSAGFRALVVDGSAHVRQVLMRDLGNLGHHAVAAATPLEAMMRLADPLARFDIVLADLGSESVDGLALLRFLAEHHPATRRVLMSGRVRLDQLQIARVAGEADAVLAKPWDRDGLAAVLNCGSTDPVGAPRSSRGRGLPG